MGVFSEAETAAAVLSNSCVKATAAGLERKAKPSFGLLCLYYRLFHKAVIAAVNIAVPQAGRAACQAMAQYWQSWSGNK